MSMRIVQLIYSFQQLISKIFSEFKKRSYHKSPFSSSSVIFYVRMSDNIFSDPYFIRKNVLINLLYSNFPPSDFNHSSLPQNFSDTLRASYHSLPWNNITEDRRFVLALIFNVLSFKSFECSDIDWFYLERCLVHFINLNHSIPNQLHSVLKRI